MLASTNILSLDADVLLLICEFANARQRLKRFSATCRRLRELSKPVLFGTVPLYPDDFRPHSFIPDSVRPYVRTLVFSERCCFAPDPVYHGEYHPMARRRAHSPKSQFLFDALHGMERLRSVVVNTPVVMGLPFWILDAILSTPQLRSISFGLSICLPDNRDLSIPKRVRLTGPIAALTTFRRPTKIYDWYLQTRTEADALSYLFNSVHATLQVAEMPSETAPLRAFRKRDWPCLRELTLRGAPRNLHKSSMVETLARMPNLRILKLEFAQRSGAGPQRLCPPGWAGGCPWPRLEVLTVSYPHPDDELYALLPTTLQELTLRCCPRHYVAQEPQSTGWYMESNRWTSSLLTSVEMLGILRKCASSLVHLRHLDIEFEESDGDIQLLRQIASAFPALTFLQLLRYRKAVEGSSASLAELGNALAPLTYLRLLRLHLDFEHADSEFEGTVTDVLTPLARPLSPSVQFVCLLVRRCIPGRWEPHRIIRNPENAEMVRLEYDGSRREIDGYSTRDDLSPLPSRRPIVF